MNNKTVFISHSSADDIISEKIYKYLENLGIGCWMDKHDIVPGIPYARAIIQGLDMCEAMVILLTSNSITSDDVLNELESAKRRGMLFISVFIEDIKLPEEFEYYLKRKQWITAFDDIDKGLKSLANALAKNLNITLIDKEAKEREKIIKEAKKDLIRLAEEYHSLGIEQSKLSHKIEDKMRFAGITHRTCPICEASVNLDSSFCHTCGWPISPIYGIKDAEYLLTDKNVQINLMKSFCNKPQYSLSVGLQKQLEASQKELTSVRKELKQVRKELDEEHKKITTTAIKSQKEENELDINNTNNTAHKNSILIIREHKLEKYLRIQKVEDVMFFIRNFCSNGFPHVGCSGLSSGLKADELKEALKAIYNINLPECNLNNSIWSLAQNIWEKNNSKFIEYNKTH